MNLDYRNLAFGARRKEQAEKSQQGFGADENTAFAAIRQSMTPDANKPFPLKRRGQPSHC
jgi:hypothetical protein